MKTLAFARRNAKEILRDPITLFFGLCFPVVLLILLSAIQRSVPVELFEIERLTPGICVFGLSFITLFAAQLIAKDRESAFLTRLYTTPLTAPGFIAGYALPLLPIALLQGVFICLAALPLGLHMSVGIAAMLLSNIPAALLFISMGLLFGSLLNVRQAGGICGALVTNLSAWLSGIWFDLSLVGGAFEKVAYALPFVHCVEAGRAAVTCDIAGAARSFVPILLYSAVLFAAAVSVFVRQMKR